METLEDFFKKTSEVVCKTLTIDQIDEDLDLFEAGLLDSLGLVNLMVALEETFQITISPEDLNIENYRSVKSMGMMVKQLSQVSMLNKHA